MCVKGIEHEDCIQKPVKKRNNNLQKSGKYKCTDCDFRSKRGGAIKKHFDSVPINVMNVIIPHLALEIKRYTESQYI